MSCCLYCLKFFVPARSSHVYCSARCRVAAWRTDKKLTVLIWRRDSDGNEVETPTATQLQQVGLHNPLTDDLLQ
jgi:hypothetical protein